MLALLVQTVADASSAPLQKIQLTGWLLAVLLITLPAGADDLAPGLLKVCIADGDIPPFTAVKNETQMQSSIRQAAAVQGWRVEYVLRPWRRCLQEVGSGQLPAIAAVGGTEENLMNLVFPQRAGEVDVSRSVGGVRFFAYRQTGTSVSWDGQRFSGLSAPVLIVAGSSVAREMLERLGVESDEVARTPELMAQMLLKREHSLAVDLEPRVRHLLAQPAFAGRFEILPAPVGEAFGYLAVSSSTYGSYGAQVERLWTEIGRLNRTQTQR